MLCPLPSNSLRRQLGERDQIRKAGSGQAHEGIWPTFLSLKFHPFAYLIINQHYRNIFDLFLPLSLFNFLLSLLFFSNCCCICGQQSCVHQRGCGFVGKRF